jgi:hypothetical protein
MIRHNRLDFHAGTLIGEYLLTPTVVSTDGLLGRFDALRVALEHLLTQGSDNTVLVIKGPSGELQFSEAALSSLVDGFAPWLQDVGLPTPIMNPSYP